VKNLKSPLKGFPIPPTVQTARTLLDQAKAKGWEVPKGLNESKVLGILLGNQKLPERKQQRDGLMPLGVVGKQMHELRSRTASILEQTVEDPEGFGMEDHEWRQCQEKTIHDVADVLRYGYNHLLFELPTGGGKSHVLGAFARSFLEAAKSQKINIEKKTKIITLTSRTNLVRQLAVYEESDREAELAEDEGSALQIGDLRQWVTPLLDESMVQVITSESRASEISKDSVLTVQTYQGLTENRLRALVDLNKLLLFILDESHNVTERVRQLILRLAPGAMILGGSATPFGPERNPFVLFDEIKDGPAQHRKHPWEKKLASHQGLVELISRKELKPPRLVKADTKISLEGVRSNGGVLNEKDVGKVLSRNLPLLKKLLHRLYTEDHPVLKATRRPQLKDRVAIAFVNSVHIAEQLSKYVEETLDVPSTVLSGKDKAATFDAKQTAMRNREIRFAATVRKGTEGLDVRAANATILLQPHGPHSAWLRRQEIGRVLRTDVEDPNDDALIIDAVYKDQPGTVSTLALFGEHEYIDGGLIAAGELREIERIIIALLQQGRTLKEAIFTLQEPRRSTAIELFGLGKKRKKPKPGPGPTPTSNDDDYDLKKVQLIEDPGAVNILKIHDREFLLKKAKEALAEHGITSRQSLIDVGSSNFNSIPFTGFGKGRAFLAAVMQVIPSHESIVLSHLKELADILGWPEEKPEQCMVRAKSALAEHGVTSWRTLMDMGIVRFQKTLFKDFGKGRAFFSVVVRKLSNEEKLNLTSFDELASILGWPKETREELLTRARMALAQQGIISRETLLDVGIAKYYRILFNGFGKGGALFGAIIRKTTNESIGLDQIKELADALGWKAESREQLLDRARAALAEHFITSRQSLIDVGSSNFNSIPFTGFGKSTKFFTTVVRSLRPGETIGILHLNELATVVGWSQENREELLERARAALLEHGISSRETLMDKGIVEFIKTSFTGFGKGKSFFGKIVRRLTGDERLLLNHLKEFANVLDW
jgi:superfamily II DNA or RNA helicase